VIRNGPKLADPPRRLRAVSTSGDTPFPLGLACRGFGGIRAAPSFSSFHLCSDATSNTTRSSGGRRASGPATSTRTIVFAHLGVADPRIAASTAHPRQACGSPRAVNGTAACRRSRHLRELSAQHTAQHHRLEGDSAGWPGELTERHAWDSGVEPIGCVRDAWNGQWSRVSVF